MAFEIENGILKEYTSEEGATKVVIPKEVTGIAPKAFWNCKELTEVELNEGLLEIGEYAFAYTAIEKVKLPDSIEKIGEEAFLFSKPGKYSWETIDGYAEVKLSKNHKKFYTDGKCLFEKLEDGTDKLLWCYKRGILTYEVPEFVTVIGRRAFSSCSKLKEVLLPDGLREIKDGAFSGTKVGQLNLGEFVREIGTGALRMYEVNQYGRHERVNLIISPQNPYYFLEKDCLYKKGEDGKITLICHSFPKNKNVTIKEGISVIGANAFRRSHITEIALPTSLEEIGKGAFSDCELKEVCFPEGLKRIASEAFMNCSKLKAVNLPASLEDFADYMFPDSCEVKVSEESPYLKLKDGILYNSDFTKAYLATKEIHNKDCILPDSVTDIGRIFAEKKVKRLVLGSGLTTIRKGAFERTQVTVLEIPETVSHIEEDAFSTIHNVAYGEKSKNFMQKICVVAGSYAESHVKELMKSDKNIVALVYKEDEKNKTLANWSYTIENGEATIHAYFGKSKKIVIPDNIKGVPVTELGVTALSKLEHAESIQIPSSVKKIGTGAFFQCTTIEELVLPASLQVIEDGAFANCKALKSIVIPEGVTELKEETFFGCESLASIDLPDSLMKIDEHWLSAPAYTFMTAQKAWKETNTSMPLNISLTKGSYSDTFLVDYKENYQKKQKDGHHIPILLSYKDVILESDAETNGNVSMENMESQNALEEALLSAYFEYQKVEESDIKHYGAVEGTWKITEIKAPDENGVVKLPEKIDGVDVTLLGIYGYVGSSDKPIRKLIIPKTVTATYDMEYWPDIKEEIVVDKENPVWSSDGSSILSKDGTKLLCMCVKQKTSYTIPDGVKEIGYRAFKWSKVEELTIPDSVVKVSGNAFDYCDRLKTIIGGNGITEYERSSFSETPWYSESKVLILGKTLLRFHEQTDHAMIPEGIEVIGPSAFRNEWGTDGMLEKVTLPSTIKVIGASAFSGRKSIKHIHLPEGLETIEESAFAGCTSLTTMILPETVKKIGTEVFYNCSGLKTVRLPKTFLGKKTEAFFDKTYQENTISAKLFYGCQNLKQIEIPNGITTIGAKAFGECYALEEIQLPDSIVEIADEAFAVCANLKQMYLPKQVSVLGKQVFPTGHNGWKNIPSQFKEILVSEGNETYCVKEGILFTKDETKLVACPCAYISSEYVIPDGVTEILPYAFKECNSIAKLVFPSSVKKIGTKACSLMENLKEVVLPSELEVLEDDTFSYCGDLKTITWPTKLREIGESCFESSGLEHVMIPEMVEKIGSYGFASLKAKTVILPKSVKEIGLSVFAKVRNIEVYDTVDENAKTAKEYLDDSNGHWNGKIGAIGIEQKKNYVPGACNSFWHEHRITVRSAKDDSIKYSVRMPANQKRKVYCTYASSWGKYAEFNFTAIDAVFSELTADAKLDYFLDRVQYASSTEEISETMQDTFKRYVGRNAKDVLERVFETDDVKILIALESYGIIKKANADERLEQAEKAGAVGCKAWILQWQNENVSAKEKARKEEKSLRIGAPTVAEMKKIWPNKKGADGGLVITGYNGKNVDVVVPSVIGKTAVTQIGSNCFSIENAKDEEQKIFLKERLESVVIPDSVKRIGDYAFQGCEALKHITIGNNVTSVGNYMFTGNKDVMIHAPKDSAMYLKAKTEHMQVEEIE